MKQNDIMAAIEYLTPIMGNASLDNYKKHLNTAISALEKQLSKRPRAEDNGGAEDYECWLECALCGEAVPEYTSENETECYCVGCGQKLDWEESE